MPRWARRNCIVYRWNPELDRWEFFTGQTLNTWVRSSINTLGVDPDGDKIVSYDETWCMDVGP